MHGQDIPILQLFGNVSIRLIVPVYQRNYDWEQANCNQLFSDIVRLTDNPGQLHFFGSVVSAANSSGTFTDRLVIDGQQRLTSVSLFLLAIVHALKNGDIASREPDFATRILNSWVLENGGHGTSPKLKLRPVQGDRTTLDRIQAYATALRGDYHGEAPDPASRLTGNFRHFLQLLGTCGRTADELVEALNRFVIVHVELGMGDDPQQVFESLNSTGVALSEGDKIRNYVLMGMPPREQEECHRDYWVRIERCTRGAVGEFVRDYMSLKTGVIPALTKIYPSFKAFRAAEEKNGKTMVQILMDLRDYSELYAILLGDDSGIPEVNGCIFRLNRLETTVTRPYLLEVLKLWKGHTLSDEDIKAIFRDVETYLFKRLVCEMPTHALNKIFAGLHREIVRYDGTTDNYIGKFRFALLSRRGNGAFPDDPAFSAAFKSRDVYLMTAKNRTYILERLENHGTAETQDVYARLDDGTYSVEHVMPQALTPEWAAALGDQCTEIHEKWLHKIANLTLTAYNSHYGNASFMEKKTMKNGFDTSGIRLNFYFHALTEWGEDEMESRSEALAKRALEIWPLPSTDFVPAGKNSDNKALDDDEDWTGRKIASYSFLGMTRKTTRWIDMFNDVVRMLHTMDGSVLPQIAEDPDNPLHQVFSLEPGTLREGKEIADGVFAEQNTSTSWKLSVLRKLFDCFKIDQAELVFDLKEDEAEKDMEQGIARYERRRQFWKAALPIIKAENESTGLFRKWKPGKENWITSPCARRGVAISCIANFSEARVQFEMTEKPDFNAKEAFDLLATRRSALENTLGNELEWKRNDDTKTSKIAVVRHDLGIADESTWSATAEFLAKWSRAFTKFSLLPRKFHHPETKQRVFPEGHQYRFPSRLPSSPIIL